MFPAVSYTGPITALTINCVPANMRVRAFAVQIFLTHAFGDAVSPTILGAVSDATGSIRSAMLLVPAAFTLGMFTWLLGWRRLANDETFDGFDAHRDAADRVKTTPGQQVETLRDPLMADASHEYSGVLDGEQTVSAIHLKRFDPKLQQRQEIM
jgi:hypothetical protein